MKTNRFLGRDWIDATLDYSKEEWETMIDVGLELKRRYAMNESMDDLLRGQTLFTIFFNQSLRTRCTFAAGIQQLGGYHVDLEPGKTYTPARKGFEIPYETERISDVSRILSRVGDAIAIRMYGPKAHWIYGFANETIKEFAEWADVPVINMECDKFHPTQALADLMTVKEKMGGFKNKKLTMSWAYSGSIEKPRAVPQSVILAASKMGMDVTLARPEGFELDPEVIETCKGYSDQQGGSFGVTDDFDQGFEDADIVYPKSWGAASCFNYTDENNKTVKEQDLKKAEKLNEANKDWITTEKQMALVDKNGRYMHCLPADRGQEVTDPVIDGPQSVVIDEAENRLHAHKAIMAMVMGGRL